MAEQRPNLPIFAVTPSEVVRRLLALYAGVNFIRVYIRGNTEAQIKSIERVLLDAGVLKKEDRLSAWVARMQQRRAPPIG